MSLAQRRGFWCLFFSIAALVSVNLFIKELHTAHPSVWTVVFYLGLLVATGLSALSQFLDVMFEDQVKVHSPKRHQTSTPMVWFPPVDHPAPSEPLFHDSWVDS